MDELRRDGWDGLEIAHCWETGAFSYGLTRCFRPGIPWGQYGSTFSGHTLLSENRGASYSPGSDDVIGIGPACAELVDSATKNMSAGRHELLRLWVNHERNIGVMLCRHSTLRESSSVRHILTVGGLRRHALSDAPRDVVLDGLNLGRAMTYKNLAAGIESGGSKLILCSEGLDDTSPTDLGFVAWAIDQARTLTGPDIGLTPAHADALRSFTPNVCGGATSGIPTAKPTAHGVVLAIETGLRHLNGGEPSWSTTSVAVQGLGAVGWAVAEDVLSRGGRVVVCDIAAERVEQFRSSHPRRRVEITDSDAILTAEVDVLSPSAIGGVITEDLIPQLRCRAVIGAANNMLAAKSPAEEMRLAKLLLDRNILMLIDWQVNVGGVITGYEEWRTERRADVASVQSTIAPRCTLVIDEILAEAAATSTTPTEVSYRRVWHALNYPSHLAAVV